MANIAGEKKKGERKTRLIPIAVAPGERLKKPSWIRVKAAAPDSRFHDIKRILREHRLHRAVPEDDLEERDVGVVDERRRHAGGSVREGRRT